MVKHLKFGLFRRLVVALACASLLLIGGAGTASAQAGSGGSGHLVDLQPSTAGPTDDGAADVTIVESNGSTIVSLSVRGISAAAATTLGAHIHVGPCVAANGGAAGPHYNSTGQPATAVSNTSEVWLDFSVSAIGAGSAKATVPFVIPAGGAQSLVIHQNPTAPDGGAGPRLACLPIAVLSNAAPADTAPAAAAPAPTAPVPAPAAPDTTASTADAAPLALTGADSAYLALTGLGLVGAGAALVRKRHQLEDSASRT